MSDYDFKPGGLKLKGGGVAEGGVTKKCVANSIRWGYALTTCRKKKKSSKPVKSEAEIERERVRQALFKQDGEGSGSGRDSPAAGSSTRKTEAEIRFEQVQRRRVSLARLPGAIY